MKGVTTLILGIICFVVVFVIVAVFLVKYTSVVGTLGEMLRTAVEPLFSVVS